MTDVKSEAVEKEVVETDTTQVAPPATKEPATEAETVEKETDQAPSTESESDLPAGSENWTEEQRRAFQEKRLENKALKEEVERLRQEGGERAHKESAFSAFRAQAPVAGQPEIRIENFTNPVTGETDFAAYNRAVNEVITQRATQSASQIAQQTTQELLDENNARQKYPELFNDPETEQEIADRWFAAKMRGEDPSIADIAGRVAKRYGKAISKAEKVGVEKALNEVSEKEQAGLSASGQTSEPARQQTSSEEFERLRTRTRVGDYDAVAARVSKIPWANK